MWRVMMRACLRVSLTFCSALCYVCVTLCVRYAERMVRARRNVVCAWCTLCACVLRVVRGGALGMALATPEGQKPESLYSATGALK